MGQRWRDCGHAFQRGPMERLREIVEGALDSRVEWLPGHGLRAEDRIALFSTFILLAAKRLAEATSAKRAADAIRRLADLVERGQFTPGAG
jgi:hypothetical protein